MARASEATVLVFTYDWVPERNDIASGGGLRGLQLIEALREAGYHVACSVPADSRYLRRIGTEYLASRKIYRHDAFNQLDIIREVRPDIVIWPPFGRHIPLPDASRIVHVYDMIGLPHVEAAFGVRAQVTPNRARLVGLCEGIDLFLTGSEEQNGYWLAQLTRDGDDRHTAIVPYALPASLWPSEKFGADRLSRLHVTGMIYPWSTAVSPLLNAAKWVSGRDGVTLSVIAGTDPGGATDREVLRTLKTISELRNVEMPGEQSFADAMNDYGPGSVALDLYETNTERRLAVPVRTVNALTHGVPIVTTIDSALTRRLEAAGAGVVVDESTQKGLGRTLNKIADMTADALGRMSRTARDFASEHYEPRAAARVLVKAISQARLRKTARRRAWTSQLPAAPRVGHVLVISECGENLRELRVDIPFTALHGRGLIDGYSVWQNGKFIFSSSSDPNNVAFDAIWVQREISPVSMVVLMLLARPFIYDIDDNLLASPAYRPAFSIAQQQSVRHLLHSCAVLSCSTARLGRELQRGALIQVIGKAFVTPNLARAGPRRRPVGPPHSLIWVASDSLPLTESALPILTAIRDFCINQALRIICIGVAPPDIFVEADVSVHHVGPVPYSAYLPLLESYAPAILACPLETNGDLSTQRFVDSKSDIKMLEALSSGLIGVFSQAAPYLESNLPGAILTENSYAAWYEALTQARTLCQSDRFRAEIPDDRSASSVGLQPWFDALTRARLETPLPASAFRHAIATMQSRYGRRQLTEIEFDAAFYSDSYKDVRAALDRGEVQSAYEHYVRDGFSEGRRGHPEESNGEHRDDIWANLMQTMGDLGAAIEMRRQATERLKARRAARITMRREML